MLKVVVGCAGVALSYILYQKVQLSSAKYTQFLTTVKKELNTADLTRSEKNRVLEFVEKIGYPTSTRIKYCTGRIPFTPKIIGFLEKMYDKKVVSTDVSAKTRFLFSDWNTEMFTEPVVQHNYEHYLVNTIVFV